MTNKKQLFMSVVVITHNGEQTIGRALESLLNQTYPMDCYEIIVVNDGSTDGTAEVVRSYPRVRYAPLAVNQGIAGARNHGISVAAGDIYVAFDDDCFADPEWLENLANGYTLDRAAGISGTFVGPRPIVGLINKYVTANGGPIQVTAAASTAKPTIFTRLRSYATARFVKHAMADRPYAEVDELYGANSSFPLAILRQVGGWDGVMSGIEDRDLSLRIKKAFPDHHFYTIAAAKVMHNEVLSLKQYLLRPVRRGPVTLRFYQAYGIIPPVFPSPILFIFCSLLFAVLSPALLPLVVIILPLLLYFWWVWQAVRERRLLYVLFCYIQLTEEAMVLAGILRGYVQKRRYDEEVA